MSSKGAGRSEFSQLVPNHLFGHVDRNVLLAVVHSDRMPDEHREDHGSPRPGLDVLLLVALVLLRAAAQDHQRREDGQVVDQQVNAAGCAS